MYVPIFVMLVFFGGARGRYVGTDAGGYVRSFESVEGMSDVYQKISNDSDEIDLASSLLSEPGYFLLNVIAKQISRNYWSLFTLIAISVVGCYLLAFSRFSLSIPISLFVLLTMGWYFFFFNGARQGIAAAIYTLSFGALINRDFKKYCLWVLLAMLFHRSIVFAIPLYFLFVRPNDFKQNVLIFLVSAFCLIFMKDIIGIAAEIITEKYAYYASVENTGGETYTLFYFLMGISFLFCKRFICSEDRPIYDVYLNMILFSGMIYVAVFSADLTQNLMRFAFYFTIAACFAWPLLLHNVRERRGLYLLVMATFILGSLGYYFLEMPKNGMLYYNFNEWLQPYIGF